VQAQILELLERLRSELGLAMILITHDLSVVAETCDRAVVMYAGQLAETGIVEHLYRRPLHPYTVRLMGSVPDIGGPRTLPDGIPGQPPDLMRPPTGCRFHPRCDHAMEVCVASYPAPRAFGESHSVACHAVADDGRLRSPAELPLLTSARVIATTDTAVDPLVALPDDVTDAAGDADAARDTDDMAAGAA
ncbi:MAG: ABC transporter ATP-binding protein, partial [Chloroflexi bacterium]|nr:ABC transporter ATP-binding protein [Chloroflexota bacterium]